MEAILNYSILALGVAIVAMAWVVTIELIEIIKEK